MSDDARAVCDQGRAAAARAGLTAPASAALTEDLYHRLDFMTLGPVKQLLKRYFSDAPFEETHARELERLLRHDIDPLEGWWEHHLGRGFLLTHGIREGRYVLCVIGEDVEEPSDTIFDRVFDGPVQPEATPNRRHVRFVLGGEEGPSTWHVRDEATDDPRVIRLFEDPDVTDVLVAPNFVTVGLVQPDLWEAKLEGMVGLVASLFEAGPGITGGGPTRDELVYGGGGGGELHYLDPDDTEGRLALLAALGSADARTRRIAVVVLAESNDEDTVADVLGRGAGDSSRIVRRAAVDAAGDAAFERLRPMLESALTDDDAWIRWKAVRVLGELGPGTSRAAIEALTEDPDFHVRFEAAAVLRV